MKNMMNILTNALLVLLLLSVTACGGGGGGGGGGSTNTAPTANAGADQAVYRDTLVTLDGSASSDANGDNLTYSWSLTSKPATSAAALSSPSIVNPTFSADVDGAYVFSLIVSDGSLASTADSVTISVTHNQALVSLTLIGGSDSIGSLQFDLILPSGFNLETDTNGDLVAGVLTATIAGVPIDYIATNYLPEDSLNLGQLTIGLIDTTGFAPDSFRATLVHDLAQGEALPLGTDFSFPVGDPQVTDLSGGALTGYSIGVAVQQQTATP